MRQIIPDSSRPDEMDACAVCAPEDALAAPLELPTDWHLMEEEPQPAGQTPADALIRSLASRGRVDMDYMAALCGLPCQDLIAQLGAAIWQNPDTWAGQLNSGWETADQYLAGALAPKLVRAREAAARWPALFTRNVLALEAAMPRPVEKNDFQARLGSPWISPEIIDEFINDTFRAISRESRVSHDERCGQWNISMPRDLAGAFGASHALFITYGTRRCNALSLLEKTLNRARLADPSLSERQKKLERAFQRWLRSHPAHVDELRRIYDCRFGFIRKRHYDGAFLDFPGMSPVIRLYPHQRDAVARIIFSRDTLLAHKVGAGKTFTMIAAAMEMKRLGYSSKNIFIVPNNMTRQWQAAFAELYPAACSLLVEPHTFTPARRPGMLALIRDGEFDGIIMAYSCAEKIPLSLPWRARWLAKKKLTGSTWPLGREEGLMSEAELEQRLYEKELDRVRRRGKGQPIPDELCFDRLGISGFFLDEAHNYKNIPIDTSLDHVRGINARGSKKCQDMLMRSDAVREAGGFSVLATGTPICNSITDVYAMQQFLQRPTLEMLGLSHFDEWAANFADVSEGLELDVDGARFRVVSRFARFHNLPELSAIFGLAADYADEIDWGGVPACAERENVVIPASPELAAYVRELSARADLVRGGSFDPAKDNMLKITTDGRKAALDMCLVDEAAPPAQGKAAHCARVAWEIWKKHCAERSAQIIFCDLSVPQSGFNIYAKLKRLLMERGVPAGEIAFIHDCVNPAQRARLYESVRQGDVRIIIGSTFKLGHGVNIQERLVALHHLDVPWRPADMVQREGRILRRGNMHRHVRIFRYVTEGSFDAYCWQVLETKQRFIASFLAGNVGRRSSDELDAHILSYAEVKAIALGEPLLRERVECALKMERVRFLQLAWEREREDMRLELAALWEKLDSLAAQLLALEKDLALSLACPADLEKGQKKRLAQLLWQAVSEESQEIERKICDYRGFSVLIRANPAGGKKGFWLSASSSFFVEMGKNGEACVTRLENALRRLPERLQKLGADREALVRRKADLRTALAMADPYAARLGALNARLAEIDRKLARD